MLEMARGEHREAMERARTAEEKATRLMQTSLALLALALTLAGFQITFLRDETSGVLPFVGLIPTAGAVVALVFAGIEALEIDRVGFYWPPDVADLRESAGAPKDLVDLELRAGFFADWTARQKVNALLQARAWFSRGVTLLLIAALIGLGMLSRVEEEPEEPWHQHHFIHEKSHPEMKWQD